MDMPEIINNIKLIIVENDYKDINHKKYVDEILMKNNFYVEYSENGCSLAKQTFFHRHLRIFMKYGKKRRYNIFVRIV